MTGGAGYIGSHACKALAQSGYIPVTFDNLVRGNEWAVRWGPLEHGDVRDRARLEAVISSYNPVAVMHFAAFAYVGESTHDPLSYYDNNLAGTVTLLESMRAHNIRHFVFSSTCATYGVPGMMPIPEDAEQNPINPYGSSKLMVERVLRDCDQTGDIQFVCLRYFNAAGADPDGDVGEAHEPETHLIPLALDAAADARSVLTIHGNDYPTADGTCVRDYVHVSDLADAHVLALDFLHSTDRSESFNLGTGTAASVLEVINTVGRITRQQVRYKVGPRRKGDPAVLVAESGQAISDLKWNPCLSDLDTIVSTAWSWRQKRHG